MQMSNNLRRGDFMKNNISLRNVLLLLAAVIIGLLVLGFVSTLLNQIVPIVIALVVGIVLGRLSVNVNVVELVKDTVRRRPAQAEAKAEPAQTADSAHQPAQASDEQVRAEADAIKKRLGDVEAEPAQGAEITDFKIKTEEELQAEARRLEAEVAKRSAQYDPSAALEERRRRLLGGQHDKS